MRHVALIIEQVADSDVTVLIRGQSGVGKQLVARAIHQRSTRRGKPFVKVNGAALPAELLDSELFGHKKGAFTGAAMPPGRSGSPRRGATPISHRSITAHTATSASSSAYRAAQGTIAPRSNVPRRQAA